MGEQTRDGPAIDSVWPHGYGTPAQDRAVRIAYMNRRYLGKGKDRIGDER